ncbi:hypothetical protein L7F22_055934 [Adiantum nelumboides]|nr:hypothetical protein [Adiantum nelumboides]
MADAESLVLPIPTSLEGVLKRPILKPTLIPNWAARVLPNGLADPKVFEDHIWNFMGDIEVCATDNEGNALSLPYNAVLDGCDDRRLALLDQCIPKGNPLLQFLDSMPMFEDDIHKELKEVIGFGDAKTKMGILYTDKSFFTASHVDHMCTMGWMLLLEGRKTFYFWDGNDQKVMAAWESCLNEGRKILPRAQYHFVVEAGSLVYIPPGDHPAQCKLGQLKDGGKSFCRRDKAHVTLVEEAHGGRYVKVQDMWDAIRASKRCATKERKEDVLQNAGLSGVSILWRLYNLYGFDISRDLVYDVVEKFLKISCGMVLMIVTSVSLLSERGIIVICNIHLVAMIGTKEEFFMLHQRSKLEKLQLDVIDYFHVAVPISFIRKVGSVRAKNIQPIGFQYAKVFFKEDRAGPIGAIYAAFCTAPAPSHSMPTSSATKAARSCVAANFPTPVALHPTNQVPYQLDDDALIASISRWPLAGDVSNEAIDVLAERSFFAAMLVVPLQLFGNPSPLVSKYPATPFVHTLVYVSFDTGGEL